MDIVQELRERYRLDPTIQKAVDEIEQLQKEVLRIGDMMCEFPSVLECTNTGYVHTMDDRMNAIQEWKNKIWQHLTGSIYHELYKQRAKTIGGD